MFRKIFGLTALLVFSFSSHAATVRWELTNVTFDDGGIATGWFEYDSSQYELSNWLISVEGGDPEFPGAIYNPETSTSQTAISSSFSMIIFSIATGGTDRVLRLDFDHELYSAPGVIDVTSSGVWTNMECFNCYPSRLIVSGTLVSAVPIPAAAWLFSSALIGLVGLKRKK